MRRGDVRQFEVRFAQGREPKRCCSDVYLHLRKLDAKDLHLVFLTEVCYNCVLARLRGLSPSLDFSNQIFKILLPYEDGEREHLVLN